MTTETPKRPKGLGEKPAAADFGARPAEAGRPSGLKVRKIGNSLGVVLPKEMLAAMRASEGAMLFPTVGPDGSLTLTAYDPTVASQVEAARGIAARYRNALRELAK